MSLNHPNVEKLTMRMSLTALAVVPLALAFLAGCPKSKDQEPPPIPSAANTAPPTPEPIPTPSVVTITTEVDAGTIEDAGAPDVKKRPAGVSDVVGLRACCSALKQNAASMPPPNNAYAATAAQVCDSMVASMASGSVSKAGALGMIGATLKGAGLPAACR